MTTLIPDRLDRGRLRYERIDAGNAEELRPLLLDPRVGETLWPTPQTPTEEQFQSWLAHFIDHWREHAWGLWLLRDAESGAMVGRGGLQYTVVEGESEVEIAWAIVPERWNQGLATELAHTSVEMAFGPLGLERLVAFTLPHNIASRRVMEKSGLQYERDFVYKDLPHVLYARGSQPKPQPGR